MSKTRWTDKNGKDMSPTEYAKGKRLVVDVLEWIRVSKCKSTLDDILIRTDGLIGVWDEKEIPSSNNSLIKQT